MFRENGLPYFQYFTISFGGHYTVQTLQENSKESLSFFASCKTKLTFIHCFVLMLWLLVLQ